MKKLMKGNEAIAEAAIQAGCRFFFGYPITPQNQIPEYMSKRLPQVGGCFLQAESEVAAINMVYGAAGAGARCMTSSSSPGISLKQEGISYIVGAELPCVIVNMVRGGPGLGSIQPAQSDYYQATRGGGHGDYRMCVLAPASVQEAVTLTQDAFDIADRYRNPVMVMGDGMIGQMMEPVDMDAAMNRQPAADLQPKTWASTGHKATEDAPRAIINSLYIDPNVLEQHCLRLEKKYAAIAQNECRWEEIDVSDAELVVVAYGTTSRIARSAIKACREKGIKVGMIRPITLWPFPSEAIQKTTATAKQYLTIEMSTGQMVDDVRLAVAGACPVSFYGRTGGMVPTVVDMVSQIEKLVGYVAPQAAENTLDSRIKGLTDKLSEMAESLTQKVEETVGSEEFQQKAADVQRQLDEAGEKLEQAGQEMGQKLNQSAGSVLDSITKALQKVTDRINNSGKGGNA